MPDPLCSLSTRKQVADPSSSHTSNATWPIDEIIDPLEPSEIGLFVFVWRENHFILSPSSSIQARGGDQEEAAATAAPPLLVLQTPVAAEPRKYHGVRPCGLTWEAQISIKDVSIYLGTFTQEEAADLRHRGPPGAAPPRCGDSTLRTGRWRTNEHPVGGGRQGEVCHKGVRSKLQQ